MLHKVSLLLLILISPPFLAAQTVELEWQKCLGGSSVDKLSDIEPTDDGGFILVGSSRSNNGNVSGNHGWFDVWLVKVDSAWNIIWQKSLGGDTTDQAYSVKQTSDGGYIFIGHTRSNNGNVSGLHGIYPDFWVVKLNSLGIITWQKCLGGTGTDFGTSIIQTSDGGYALTGMTTSADGDVTGYHNLLDVWTVKLDASGNIQWQKCLGGSNDEDSQALIQTPDGGYLVVGYTMSNDGDVTGNHGNSDVWVAKLSSTGLLQWQRCYGGTNYEKGRAVQNTSDGGYIIAGYTNSNDGDVQGLHQSYDYWVLKLSSTGTLLWQKCLGGNGTDYAYDIQLSDDGGYVVNGLTNSNNGDVSGLHGIADDIWACKINSIGNIQWQKCLGGTNTEIGWSIHPTDDGNYIVGGEAMSTDGHVTGLNGVTDYWGVKLKSGIMFEVYNDVNQNCLRSSGELGVSGFMVTVSPLDIVTLSDSIGTVYIDSLPDGVYTATIDTTNLNWQINCSPSQTFTILNNRLLGPVQFALFPSNPCSSPNVSIVASRLRPCLNDQNVHVLACNEVTATGILNSPYVDVNIDPMLTVNNCSLPYLTLGNNEFRVNINTLNPGECSAFHFSTTLDCNAIIGQTICMDATLYPIQSCALDTIPSSNNSGSTGMVSPCTSPWDSSSLSIIGWCDGDSVKFQVTNTGPAISGDMTCFSEVRIYMDTYLSILDSVKLPGQGSTIFTLPANGHTWTIQADQHPLHPGDSHPNAHVELCGSTSNWAPDLINCFPLDDADPVVDIFCGPVRSSYDPNDKTGYPTGLDQQHYIFPNQQIQYLVRFQNTGNDTAYTIIVRDTLDVNLNIYSVVPGASSHNYSFRMYGPRVLEWTFSNILLPDSNTNEPQSHGFIMFTVDQLNDLAPGTVIHNDADIYFDFNPPVITNETVHTIRTSIPGLSNEIIQESSSSIFVFPNPSTGIFNLVLGENFHAAPYSIVDQLGKVALSGLLKGGIEIIDASELPPGIYFLHIRSYPAGIAKMVKY